MRSFFVGALTLLVLSLGTTVYAYHEGELFGFRWWSWNQRLSIEVETPRGIQTASAVTEASWSMPPTWFKIGDSGGGPGLGSLNGEALVLELEPGRYLFALLKDYSAMTAVQAFAGPNFKPGLRNDYVAVLDRLVAITDTRILAREHYPLLVTFDDINDPASVRSVNPSDFAATLGPGYRLHAVTLAITEEPVTEGKVETVLGWLRDRNVMERPGWLRLPLESRRAISGLLTYFPQFKG